MSVFISTPATAKLVRMILKEAFPGVRFFVNSRSYAGGASIDVGWMDGPTIDQVRAMTQPLADRAVLSPENQIRAGVDYAARSGADYIMGDRCFTPDFLRRYAAYCKAETGLEPPRVKRHKVRFARKGKNIEAAYFDLSDLKMAAGNTVPTVDVYRTRLYNTAEADVEAWAACLEKGRYSVDYRRVEVVVEGTAFDDLEKLRATLAPAVEDGEIVAAALALYAMQLAVER